LGFYADAERSRKPRIHRHYPSRQLIFQEGDPAIYVFYIHAGAVKLTKTGAGEKPVVLRLLGPGDVFGYRAVLTDEDYAATAEALQECTVCAIPRDSFLTAIQSNMKLAQHFVRLLCDELRESEELWLQDSQESAQKHTMRILQRLANEQGEILTGGRGNHRTLLRSEIAELIGISPETLSRTLKKLAERGVLSVDRNIIRLGKALKIVKEH